MHPSEHEQGGVVGDDVGADHLAHDVGHDDLGRAGVDRAAESFHLLVDGDGAPLEQTVGEDGHGHVRDPGWVHVDVLAITGDAARRAGGRTRKSGLLVGPSRDPGG